MALCPLSGTHQTSKVTSCPHQLCSPHLRPDPALRSGRSLSISGMGKPAFAQEYPIGQSSVCLCVCVCVCGLLWVRAHSEAKICRCPAKEKDTSLPFTQRHYAGWPQPSPSSWCLIPNLITRPRLLKLESRSFDSFVKGGSSCWTV